MAPVSSEMEIEHLRRISFSLGRAVSLADVSSTVVEECLKSLHADAACLYLTTDSGDFEMIDERGCTPEFKERCRHLPRSFVPLARKSNGQGGLFIGSAEATKNELSAISDLVDRSPRKTVVYAPLVADDAVVGLLGFSYNSPAEDRIHREFVSIIVNLCALAVARSQLFEKERAARQAAEAANQAKTEFLANVSHEIRTPTAAIQGFAQLLAGSEGLTSNQKAWASIVDRNARQLTQLIGEVLDISKIEADHLQLELAPFAIGELLEDLGSAAALKAEGKGLKFETHFGMFPASVTTDGVRLRQILMNLVGNAIKFTSNGEIRIDASHENNELHFRISDTGIGIAIENQAAVFEPFVQADNSTRRKFGGTGLGLSISKRLAEALGGTLELVESTFNQGSTFQLRVPCPAYAQETPSKRPEGPRRKDEDILKGLSLLVVDDSEDNQELLKWTLNSLGARVMVASGGQQGIELASTQMHDAVLMDIQMPEIDGHQATSILRSRGYDKPIVALTAHALASERSRCLREGFDEYLTKPINLDLLASVLKNLVGKRAAAH